MKVVIQEIIQDKIYLDTETNTVRVRGTDLPAGPPELDFDKI